MKEKLSRVRDALVIYGKADDGIIAFTKGFSYRGEKDENSRANKAITLLDSILADLDSPELVGIVGIAIADAALKYRNKNGSKCLSIAVFTCDMAKAAINTIKGE